MQDLKVEGIEFEEGMAFENFGFGDPGFREVGASSRA